MNPIVILDYLVIVAIVVGLINLFKRPKTDHQINDKIEHLSSNMTELKRDFLSELGQNRQELNANLTNILNITHHNLVELTEQINQKFDRQFKDLQESNEKKLSQIQNIVDEKLQETLNRRIAQSFEQVTNLLTSVDKGLGEMRGLASDVDSLQRVMTGVKTRGIVGEIQLGNILEQIFSSAQYRAQENIQGTNAVDYAVVMPGKSADSEVLLPIDSKFPLEDYQRLTQAQEDNDLPAVEAARKALFAAVKLQAKSISEKYIFPPKTTDFAIMFLPTEGLFMEIVNNVELYEQISRDYKVNLTGPTTMTAVLNSLQMGFKTLQIEQKSSEVYKLLGAVKTEFNNFEGQLVKVQSRLRQSEDEVNKLIGTRTRAMNRKLRQIEEIDAVESNELLGFDENEES